LPASNGGVAVVTYSGSFNFFSTSAFNGASCKVGQDQAPSFDSASRLMLWMQNIGANETTISFSRTDYFTVAPGTFTTFNLYCLEFAGNVWLQESTLGVILYSNP
jgi:hypothetical protein